MAQFVPPKSPYILERYPNPAVNQTLMNRISIVLACIGLFVAGVLSMSHLTGRPVPCGMSAGCDIVQAHPTSKWGNIPVAYFGMAAYVLLLGLGILRSFAAGKQYGAMVKTGFWFSIIGAAISMVLQVISFTFIQATCYWCLGSALVMIALALNHAFMVQNLPSEVEVRDAPEALLPKKLDIGLIAIVVLATLGGLGFQYANFGNTTAIQVKGDDQFVARIRDGRNAVGPLDAKLTIVEFADMYCPSCRLSFAKMEKLMKEHDGKVRWVYRHFPLYMKEDHKMALPAAILSEVASDSGKFWDFTRAVFTAGEKQFQTEKELLDLAESLGVDRKVAETALASESSPQFNQVYSDIQMVDRLGLEMTPSFIVYLEGEKPVTVTAAGLDQLLSGGKYKAALEN